MTRQYAVDCATQIAEIVKQVLHPPREQGGYWYTDETVVKINDAAASIRVPGYGWGTDETISSAFLRCYIAGYLTAISDQRALDAYHADMQQLARADTVRH